MKAVLAGGSGALGRRIAVHLSSMGYEVVILTRNPVLRTRHRQVQWDGKSVGGWAEELKDALVVNLAGELVDRRPTRSNIELLTRSRVDPTRALVAASRTLEVPPRLWMQASTLAIYGDTGEQILDETAEPAEEPPQMAGVARAWEEAAAEAAAERQVVMRMGIVLDRGTPALDRLVSLTRWGLGGRIGSGRQWISWIHISDLLSVVRRVVEDETLPGLIHVTSPNPVRNADMMATLRRVLRRPPAPPTPVPMVRLGALLLRTDPALALTGRRCVPRRLLEAGFQFAYPDLTQALADLLSRPH